MNVSFYDIFSGRLEKDAVWLEAVAGLGNAMFEMRIHAAKTPGHYFVFCLETQKVMASVDSRAKFSLG
jgi:hypothetical protein